MTIDQYSRRYRDGRTLKCRDRARQGKQQADGGRGKEGGGRTVLDLAPAPTRARANSRSPHLVGKIKDDLGRGTESVCLGAVRGICLALQDA